jgi:formate hydrogenlyase subunit 3/multisubunit Na+/H+ antiporter MnhD subunit
VIPYLGALAILLSGAVAALVAARHPGVALRLGSAGAVLGSAVGLAAVGPFLLGGPAAELVLGWSEPVGAFRLRLDPLAAFFQLALFAVAIPASLYGAGYMGRHVGRRPLASFFFFFDLLLASISLVLAAADAVLFLVAWELMTVAAFVLVTFEDEQPHVRRAGFTFLVASHLGTACLVALFLLLGRGAGGFDFARFEALRASGSAAPALLFGLGLVGFGTKAGLVPLHVWLPEAHPAAPSHVSALLSAVMIKTGVYGLLRVLGFLPGATVGHGLVLGGIGLASAVAGITMAMGQGDLKRALAYSSVENVGLVVLGIGMGVVGNAAGLPVLAALGFGGALLHVWNHALMKGLAFMGAGTLVHAARTQDLERMGGLLARLPVSGSLLLVGAAALAAVPPLAGFASEWLLYIGLLSGAGAAAGAGPLLAYLAVAILALVGALATIAFTRIVGVALLGAPRSPGAEGAREVPPLQWAPLVLLAAGCLLFGLFPAWPLRGVAPAAVQVGGAHVAAVLAPSAALAAPPVALALALLALAAGLAVLASRLRSSRPAGASETWGCGFVRPTPRMAYTASSYAQLLLSGLVPRALQPRVRLVPPRGVFPGPSSLRTEAQDPARTRLFDPLFRGLGDRMSRLRRLQAGRLNLQLLYTLVTLLALAAGLALRGRLR